MSVDWLSRADGTSPWSQVHVVVAIIVEVVAARGRRNALPAETRLEVGEVEKVRGGWERDGLEPEGRIADSRCRRLGQQHDDFEAQGTFCIQDSPRRCERNVRGEARLG